MLLFSGGQTEVGKPYYHYAYDWLKSYLAPYVNKKILFIPWAIWGDHGAQDMFKFGQEQWGQFGLTLTGLHNEHNFEEAIKMADVIITGGGSIHLLVNTLAKNDLFPAIRVKVNSGALYIGTSAGSIIACPTMHTALEPSMLPAVTYDTMGVIPFQIATHYYDHDPDEFHHGPPPIVRIKNYLRLNPHPYPVACLRDGSFLQIENGEITVQGIKPVTYFDLNLARTDINPGEREKLSRKFD